jgi:uncharacterized delta-60 repeat protein
LCLLLAVPCTAGAACDPNIPADLTGDCHVDFNDFALMASDWLTPAVPQQWVARYNGSGSYGSTAYAIAIDSNDNIYVTGGSSGSDTGTDYATLKYSPHNNEAVWVARYNGPDYDLPVDVACAIAIDSNDNIYVTGRSRGPGTLDDYATIKYSPDSNQPVWVARYDGPYNREDEPQAIAVDSSDNIYVTGRSRGPGTLDDYATIKYSPDSNQPVWVARYNGPANDYDDARAIVVDSSDNIYVTGTSSGSGTELDYATIKYSSESNEPIWVARYNSSGNDIAKAIVIDSNDNIYVTGQSDGNVLYDYATVKYSPDSNQPVWVARYNGPENMRDSAIAIAVDSNDNIYVTGQSTGVGTGYDYATIKYPTHSNQPVWVARYNGLSVWDDEVYAIAIDSNNNIYVTGWGVGPGSYDCTTIKYSPDSNQPVWVARYNGPGNGDDWSVAIAIDSNDNIYVTGAGVGFEHSLNYLTIKYSPDLTCNPQITGDFDLDCDVDIYDLEVFCQSWLDCNLDPPEGCWE